MFRWYNDQGTRIHPQFTYHIKNIACNITIMLDFTAVNGWFTALKPCINLLLHTLFLVYRSELWQIRVPRPSLYLETPLIHMLNVNYMTAMPHTWLLGLPDHAGAESRSRWSKTKHIQTYSVHFLWGVCLAAPSCLSRPSDQLVFHSGNNSSTVLVMY